MNKTIRINDKIQIKKNDDNFEVLNLEDKKIILDEKEIINSISNNSYVYPEESIIIIIGIGLGLVANHLIQIENIKKIYIIEPQEAFQEVFSIYNNDNNNFGDKERVKYVESDVDLIKNDLFSLFIRKSYNIELLYLDHYLKFYSETLLKYIKEVKEIILDIKMNFSTFLSFSEQWQINLIKNYKEINNSKCLYKYHNKFKNQNVAIISAGPSLDNDIDYLKKYKDYWYIMSCGRTVEALLKNGIVPDFIVAIDGGLPQFDVMKNILNRNELKEVPLLYNVTTHYKVIRDYVGPKIPFETQIKMKDIFGRFYEKEIYKIDGGTPSVANAILDISYMFGFQKMIFFGQDLSYPGEKLHSNNSAYEDNKVIYSNKKKRYTKTKAVNGKEVVTSEDLLMFKRNIEKFIADKKDREYINISQEGAFIEGMKHMIAKKVINDLISEKKADIYMEKLKMSNDRESIDNLGMMLSELKNIDELIVESLELVDKLEKNKYNNANLRKYNLLLNEIEEKIINKTKETNLLTMILQRIFFWAANEKIDSTDPSYTNKIILKTKKFYTYMKVRNEKVMKMIEESINEKS